MSQGYLRIGNMLRCTHACMLPGPIMMLQNWLINLCCLCGVYPATSLTDPPPRCPVCGPIRWCISGYRLDMHMCGVRHSDIGLPHTQYTVKHIYFKLQQPKIFFQSKNDGRKPNFNLHFNAQKSSIHYCVSACCTFFKIYCSVVDVATKIGGKLVTSCSTVLRLLG